jgi:hypothetical protein
MRRSALCVSCGLSAPAAPPTATQARCAKWTPKHQAAADAAHIARALHTTRATSLTRRTLTFYTVDDRRQARFKRRHRSNRSALFQTGSFSELRSLLISPILYRLYDNARAILRRRYHQATSPSNPQGSLGFRSEPPYQRSTRRGTMTWAMTVLVAYLTVMGLLLFILLFGEAQLFQHTPVQWAHSFVTRDAWALSMRVIRRVCGARCADVVSTRPAPPPAAYCLSSAPCLRLPCSRRPCEPRR